MTMTRDTGCRWGDGRESALMAYLYNEAEPPERAAFDRHLSECMMCRLELAELADIREGLATWAMPEVAEGVGGQAPRAALRLVDPVPGKQGWKQFADAPVWLQAAAAMLVAGAALGMANLNLTYSPADGLRVTTGWVRAADESAADESAADESAAAQQPSAPATVQAVAASPWRDDISALEQRLVQTIQAQPGRSDTNDDTLLKQVRSIVQESERRQQNELLLRVSELAKEHQVQRQGDLQRIDQMFGVVQNRAGMQVRQQEQRFNELVQRVSSSQPR